MPISGFDAARGYAPAVSRLRLSAVNLNLLPALDALLQECHVTRAADRAGVTQSAMSYSLRQLRDLLEDPLLVRGPGGMVRTARAEELAPRVRAALEHVERALAPVAFDPASSTRGFSIASADSTFATTVLPLQQTLAEVAPGLRLRLSLLGLAPYQDRLESGEIDLALGMGFSKQPGVHRALLYEEPYGCAVREGHPLLAGEMGTEVFAGASHVIVTRRTTVERTPIDAQLEALGLERRIAMQVPSFPLALAAARTTDLVVSGPLRYLRSRAATVGLRVFPHPLVTRRYQVFMVWHARADLDPANQWLRQRIQAVVAGPSASPRPGPVMSGSLPPQRPERPLETGGPAEPTP